MSYSYQIVTREHTDGKEALTLEDLSCIQAIKDGQPLENDELVGTLSFELQEEFIYVRDLWVLESERRQGIGSELMSELDSYASALQCGGIIITAVIPQEEKDIFQRFLLQNGYLLPQCMECVMDVEISSIKQSNLASMPERKSNRQLYQMDSLPPHLNYDYRKRICASVIPACTLEHVKGTLIPELSLALAGEREISAYVIFSELEGMLYLSGIYSSQRMNMDLLSLLQICTQRIYEHMSRWKTLRFTIINHSGYHLGTTLLNGAKINKELLYQSYKLL